MSQEINNLNKLPLIFHTIRDSLSFEEMLTTIRNMIREYLCENAYLMSKELETIDMATYSEFEANFKIMMNVIGNPYINKIISLSFLSEFENLKKNFKSLMKN
jgi:hypothetical protein